MFKTAQELADNTQNQDTWLRPVFQALFKSQRPARSVWLERVKAIPAPMSKLCWHVKQLLLVCNKQATMPTLL